MDLNDSENIWDLIVERVDAYIAAWEAGEEPPQPGDFLPEGPSPMQRMTLVELLKVDLGYRWKRSENPKKIEQYIDECPLLSSAVGVPCDLIFEEYQVRRQCGETVAAEEYFRRFPRQADQLRGLLGIKDTLQSTVCCTSSQLLEVEAGQQLDEFDLLVMLGKGSFAKVFLARQRSMERLVAVKVSADRGTEPQTLAQLDHPHIVRVYDQKQLPQRELRLLYMQHVAGGTLQEVISRVRQTPPQQRSGRLLLDSVDAAVNKVGGETLSDSTRRSQLAQLPWTTVVCRIGAQLASALDYAHSRGILHRDVKPANVLLASDGSPKLADFNISFSSKIDGVSPAAYFGGSLSYMSPEQLEACNPTHSRTPEELDCRSDLYSLSVVLWELLYGQRPYGEEHLADEWSMTLEEMANRRRTQSPPEDDSPLASDRKDLRQILLRCMSPDSADRFDSCEALQTQLQLCLRPRARWLLCDGDRGWRQMSRFLALAVVLLCAFAPNALAGWFNFVYNRAILEQLGISQQAFWLVQAVINSIAYPIGVCVLAWLSWSVVRWLRTSHKGKPIEAQPSDSILRRALRLGHYAAIISLVEWLIAGFAYPITLYVLVESMTLEVWFQLIASLTLCGLIVAAYPFFCISYVALRAIYPNLLKQPHVSDADATALLALARWSSGYLLSAGAVPMLAVALLVLTDSQLKLALAVLSCVGLVGFGFAFAVYRTIQSDVAALVGAAESSESR